MLRLNLEFRISITLIILMIPVFLFEISEAYSVGVFVYVSNGDDGNISIMKLSEVTGDLSIIGKVTAGPDVKHMSKSPDNRFLYASIRSEPYSVITYSISPETGNLTQLSKTLLPDNMVYVSVDQTGRFLLSASYGGGKIAVNSIDVNGSVQPNPVQTITSGPNPHSIQTDSSNQFVYVPHLGSDQIKQYLFNESTGSLTPNNPAEIHTKHDSGPRHFVFSPDNRFLFVSNEKDGTVYSYRIDNKTGTLTEVQRVSVLPLKTEHDELTTLNGKRENEPIGVEHQNLGVADIHITPNGKWLYVSERVNSSITAFAVDDQIGNLTYIGNYETEKIPRGFNIDPLGNYLIAAGEESGKISVYAINQEKGELEFKKSYDSGKDPNWIEIVKFN